MGARPYSRVQRHDRVPGIEMFRHDADAHPATPVTLGTFEADDAARRYVTEALDSGRLSYGPFCQRFEAESPPFHDSTFAVVSNSGTSALHVALQAMKELYG